MAYLSDWVAGTITVTNGSATVTGVSTVWNGAGLAEGDLIFCNNLVGVIQSVDSATQITLTQPWQGVTSATRPYRARYQSDGSRYTAVAKQVLQDIQSGNLSALSGLAGTANSLPMFTGAGAMSLLATGTTGRAILGAADQASAAAQGGFVSMRGGVNFSASVTMRFGWHNPGGYAIAQADSLELGAVWTEHYINANPSARRTTLGAFATTGGTISGSMTVNGDITLSGWVYANGGVIRYNGAAGTAKQAVFSTAGVYRWAVVSNSEAESGSNNGSNFSIERYDDAGSWLGQAVTINRRYGYSEFRQTPQFWAQPGSGNVTLTTGQNYGLLPASSGFSFNRGASGAAATIGGNPGVGGRAVHLPIAGLYRISAVIAARALVSFAALGVGRNGAQLFAVYIGSSNFGTYTRTSYIYAAAGDYLSFFCAAGSVEMVLGDSEVSVELIQV